jgi:nitroreductase
MSAVDEAICSRRSVRQFRPDAVPWTDVRALLDVARYAPSGSNTQPWRVHVLTGPPLRALADEVSALVAEGSPDCVPEYVYYANPLPEPYLTRRRANGWGLYGLLGIAKGDRAATERQAARNFQFFDAPVGLFFFIDDCLAQGSWLDYGMFIQSVMIAARGRGLHTCPQAAWLPYHTAVRRHCGMADTQQLVCGMALGYEDTAAHVNTFRAPRVDVEAFTTSAGFGGAGSGGAVDRTAS